MDDERWRTHSVNIFDDGFSEDVSQQEATVDVSGFTKKEATVETATYGSEFVAARTAAEQIMDLRCTLRAMGVPIEERAWMLGDNNSVITSSTIPYSLLSKRHQFLAYHKVRSAIAGGYLNFCFIRSK